MASVDSCLYTLYLLLNTSLYVCRHLSKILLRSVSALDDRLNRRPLGVGPKVWY
mgnify:CR=1 FL=1